MRKKEVQFLPERASASQIVIYIVKRIHAEDVTRPTVHPASNGWQSMPVGMSEAGVSCRSTRNDRDSLTAVSYRFVSKTSGRTVCART